jgi:hypothetical protein
LVATDVLVDVDGADVDDVGASVVDVAEAKAGPLPLGPLR